MKLVSIILGGLALTLGFMALRCRLGVHSYGWQFVGDSWNPDLYVRVCRRCGEESR